MNLSIQNIGKHYQNKWLFKDVSFTISTGESIAITGINGSGKSTLMQIIYGLVQQNKGEILIDNTTQFEPSNYFSLSAPYLELPIEFNISAIVNFHQKIGKLDISLNNFIEISEFTKQQSLQEIKLFSSGMQQRLKTAFCLLSTHPIKLLDEPLTNIDIYGEKWYHNLLNIIKENHIIIIAGNAENERMMDMKLINI